MAWLGHGFGLLKETYQAFSRDECMSQGAALAFYTIFSLPPILIILITVTGFFLGSGQAKEKVLEQVRAQAGPQVAQQLEQIRTQQQQGGGTLATVFGALVVIVAATGVINQLQTALDRAWGVRPNPEQEAIRRIAIQRAISFAVVVVIAALLLIALVLSTLLSAFGDTLSRWLGHQIPGSVWGGVNTLVSLVILALLFAVLFKVLPNAKVAWRDVWMGAAVTAVLFVIGKVLIGFYLSRATIASPYGAAGSLVLLLVWVYYSSLILLAGAEFTQVWARARGRRITPAPGAVPVEPCPEPAPEKKA